MLTRCEAGFSQIDITPDFPVELIGCYRPDSTSRGILHPLCAQTAVFSRAGERYCLVTVDSLGLTTGLSDTLRQRIARILGTSASAVMLCFSHTHSAPAPLSPLNGERYYQLLCERIEQCVAEAASSLRPCSAGWSVTETGVGENRREGCTEVDRRLGALRVTDAGTGRPMAVLVRLTAHANILMSGNDRISSDFFHTARVKLQERFQCPVMLIQGAAGNVKPTGVDKILGGGRPDLDRIADQLFQDAKRLSTDTADVGCLQMASRPIRLVSDVPFAAEAERIAADARRECGVDGTAWLAECGRLREAEVTEQIQEREIHLFRLNDGGFCGVAEELFCEISLDAASRAGTPLFFLNGYTNGCAGYLPHRAEWVKGGYETLYSYLSYYPFHEHVLPFRPDTADRIAEEAVRMWMSSARA